MPGRLGRRQRNRTKKPQYYWIYVARTKPEAQALATRLGLDFPSASEEGFQRELVYPIRRLTVTGEDTPANFTILLGPLWESTEEQLIKNTRRDVLIGPIPGSLHSVLSIQLDKGSPGWTPRAPNAVERIEVKAVKDMISRATDLLDSCEGAGKIDKRELSLAVYNDMRENDLEKLVFGALAAGKDIDKTNISEYTARLAKGWMEDLQALETARESLGQEGEL